MSEPQFTVGKESETPIDRREFLRRAALLAAGAASAPLLAACDLLGPGPTVTPVPPLPTAAASPVATNTALPSPAPITAATSTLAPAQTETIPSPPIAAPTAEPIGEATATSPATATQLPAATEVAPAPTETPAAAIATPQPTASPTAIAQVDSVPGPHGVALLASADRSAGVPAVLGLLGFAPDWLSGQRVALKANFNSADAPPASTHIDTLRALLQALQNWGAAQITLLERSGQGNTRQVLRQLGVIKLASEFGVEVVVLDDLPAGDWVRQEGAHWRRGFLFPRQVLEADAVVQTCCLKTHRFGGHFTMSLKNSVGLVAKYDPEDGYNYMGELHGSANQRLMIAEINAAYRPALILLDGVRAFVSGGPDQGKLAEAKVLLAGRDTVAVDAVGVAMLRVLGTTPEVSRGAIFDQPQIARAAALGLGAPEAAAVSLHPAHDEQSESLAAKLRGLLAA